MINLQTVAILVVLCLVGIVLLLFGVDFSTN